MAVKKKSDNSSRLTFYEILIAVLTALAAGIAGFIIILVAGFVLFSDAKSPATADHPPAQTIRGTLPSEALEVTPPSVEPSMEPSDEPEPAETLFPQAAAPTQEPAPTTIRGRSSDTIVYVSSAGKIHSIPNCSGMRYYTRVTLGDANRTASRGGYTYCSNCW